MAELAPLHPVSRRHLGALTTESGIMQHARGARPDPAHGYCTDDAARALLVDLLHQRELGWEAVEASAARHLAFLIEAFEATSGRFRNFRAIDGTWLDSVGSEDANARALHALGETIASAPSGDVRSAAMELFERAFPSASRVHSLRPLAAVVLACDAAVRAGQAVDVMARYSRLQDALMGRFQSHGSDSDWPWPEPVLTYENELPPRALIVCGRRFDRPDVTRVGLRVLDWLIDAQTAGDGHLSTIGNAGWWPRGGPKARFDQQAIAATSLLLAAGAAYEATGRPRYRDAMEMAYAWFLGRNDLGMAVADPASGACRDGIGRAEVNQNRGAESTLMWNIATEHIRALRSGAPARHTPHHGRELSSHEHDTRDVVRSQA